MHCPCSYLFSSLISPCFEFPLFEDSLTSLLAKLNDWQTFLGFLFQMECHSFSTFAFCHARLHCLFCHHSELWFCLCFLHLMITEVRTPLRCIYFTTWLFSSQLFSSVQLDPHLLSVINNDKTTLLYSSLWMPLDFIFALICLSSFCRNLII